MTSMEDEITLESLQFTVENLHNKGPDVTRLIRIPPKLYQANPEAFTPELVSIGPFHHIGHNFNRFKDVNVLAMEGKKRVYMLNLLKSCVDEEELKLEACKNFLKEKSKDLRDCYSEESDMSEELLLKIMLVDDCFILGLFLSVGDMNEIDHVAERYPRDLALLENQIPFFVLEGLLHIFRPEVYTNGTMQNNFIESLLCFFRLSPESPPVTGRPWPTFDFKHMLDLMSRCYSPNSTTSAHTYNLRCLSKGIHLLNATKLWDAGVTFQSVSGKRLLDVEFSNGMLKFSPLVIHDSTETILTNLLAYEHLSSHNRVYFTSYVVLMSLLIKSPEDFQLLEKQGIFVNELGSREDASKIFSNISRQFVIKYFYYGCLCDQVGAYVDSKWLRYMQDLKRRCFNSPWTTVSVIAATVLLILTALQTIFSVLSYYQPKLT